jgi:small conductance mechanosensitive channel
MDKLQLALDWSNRTPLSILLGILTAVLIIILGRWVARLISRLASRSMERANVDSLVIRFARTLIYTGLMVAVVIAALDAAGVQTTSFTALLAAAGLAIGLALKDSLSNFASGVMILLFKPYTVSDFVEVAGTGGSVEEVSLFHTILRTPDNVKVIVPNSSMISGTIRNYSAHDHRRIDLVTAIGYDDNIGKARDILLDIVKAHPQVLADPEPAVEVLDLADTKVVLAVRPWARTEDYGKVRGELLEQIKCRFDEAGIGLPHPRK